MLRTLPQTRSQNLTYRLAGIGVFTLITILSARVTIEIGPVPFTLQPLAVLLSGMILGWRDGLLSQAAYVGLIALGAPLDARAIGTAALLGPTAGDLIGVIYLFGAVLLKVNTGMDWATAWQSGVAPFLAPDLVKALIAAALTESGRRLFMNNGLQ